MNPWPSSRVNAADMCVYVLLSIHSICTVMEVGLVCTESSLHIVVACLCSSQYSWDEQLEDAAYLITNFLPDPTSSHVPQLSHALHIL